MKYSIGISNFLEKISSLSLSIVFLYFFTLITQEGFLVSMCYSLELCIQSFMNQGKFEVVKQVMARVNIDILGISKLKRTRMGEFKLNDLPVGRNPLEEME